MRHSSILAIAILLSTFTIQIAKASSKYEKIKTLYQQAVAPSSESNLLDRVSRLSACAEFISSNPDQNNPASLKVISHTINRGGPEFPDRIIKGLGFANADTDTVKFFESYKGNLGLSEFSVEYGYQHFEAHCYDYSDGSSYCSGGSTITIAENFQIRISKKYVLYQKAPDLYGYCWERQ